jgi:hypothetical protein
MKAPAASRDKIKTVELNELIGRLKGEATVSYEEGDQATRPPRSHGHPTVTTRNGVAEDQ